MPVLLKSERQQEPAGCRRDKKSGGGFESTSTDSSQRDSENYGDASEL